MGLVSWIILGLIAGIVARVLHPGRHRGGCVVTILLGIAGALLGGYIATMFGWGRVNDFSLRSLSIAVMGALILLILNRAVFGKSRR